MKIAIVGAPEAGKSSLARKVAWALNHDAEFLGDWHRVDGYVDSLERRTGKAYGYLATFEQNLQIHFERWTRELELEHRERDTITCGTIYETLLYSAIKTHRWTNDPAVVQRFALESETTMQMLGMLELGTDYDLIFYLPYSAKMVEAKGDDWDLVIDRKLPEIVESYWRVPIVLTKTEKENVKDVVEIIRKHRAVPEDEPQAPSDDEPAVR